MGLFSGSFGTGFVTGLASSVDRSMRDAITRRNSEMSEARKYLATRTAAKRDAAEAKKLKQDEANQLAFDALATQLGGDTDLTYAAFKRLGTAEDVQSYLADVKTTRKALQPGEVYDPKADFTGYQKGKTPVTREAALSDLSIPMPAISKISGSDLGIDDQIGRMFGREGQAADKAAARLNERFASDAPAARTPLTGTGTVTGIDLSRQTAAQEAGFAATKRERAATKFNMEVSAFKQNASRLAQQMTIADSIEARAKEKALSDAEQRKLDNSRNEIADLQRKTQLEREAEMFIIEKKAKELGIEVEEYKLQKSKEAPQFNDYEEMAVYYSNRLGQRGLTTQQKNDFSQLRNDAIAGAAAFNQQTGGTASFFGKGSRDTLINSEIKRMLEPFGMVDELGQQIQEEIDGNLPSYFDGMTRALDNLTRTTAPLNDNAINSMLLGQKEALKARKKQYKEDFAAPKEAADYTEFKSNEFKSTLEIGDVVTYTTDSGDVAVRIWTGNRYIN